MRSSRLTDMDFKARHTRRSPAASWVTRLRRRPALLAAVVGLSGLMALAMTGGNPMEETVTDTVDTADPAPQTAQADRDEWQSDPEPVGSRPGAPLGRWQPSALMEPFIPFYAGETVGARIAAMEASMPEPTDPYAEYEKVEVQSGDSLARIFGRIGLSAAELHRVINADEQAKALTRIHPGNELYFRLTPDGEGLEELRYPLSRTRALHIARDGDGFQVNIEEEVLETRRLHAVGEINRSLYLAGRQAGLSNRQIMQLMSIFEWQLDFNRDVRSGDMFSVVYEADFLNGEQVRDGRIVAAKFINRGNRHKALHYELPDGSSGYYTPDGENLRKAFIRRPVQNARISSGFNRNRKHPVLGVTRPHLGTDFAAPTGTPIMASGSGRVIRASRHGGYGHTVIIQHSNQYRTLYAHLSRYGEGIREGARVEQGQIIGYVGRSGLATGPHLHYEFMINGAHYDPMRVNLPNGDPVPQEHLADFKASTSSLLAQLERVTETQLALLETD
ncbi:MAG: peptidoglycan DD-metalloendopeptidase family protein [Ectothiorhodospiraceae bacterium]|nr:peptidoglycan DD-metalloendopeptidase family protein [Ectothiorhodospiraceae bacterium]